MHSASAPRTREPSPPTVATPANSCATPISKLKAREHLWNAGDLRVSGASDERLDGEQSRDARLAVTTLGTRRRPGWKSTARLDTYPSTEAHTTVHYTSRRFGKCMRLDWTGMTTLPDRCSTGTRPRAFRNRWERLRHPRGPASDGARSGGRDWRAKLLPRVPRIHTAAKTSTSGWAFR